MNKKLTVIGGGTGISHILRGLKKYPYDLSAIVNMTDNGGGSGMIRSQWGLLPPGDLRNCLIALANTEPVMENLINFRYKDGPLQGQNFGNLLIATMVELYGSMEEAVKELSQVLKVSGKVFPVTLENTHLVASFQNGEKCIGESAIPVVAKRQGTKIDCMKLFPKTPHLYYECGENLQEADYIFLGPGSLYTSIIPNLLVQGMTKALKKSKGKKILLMNIMTQAGETEGLSLRDHIQALEFHSYEGIVDICLVNNRPLSKAAREAYEKDGLNQIFLEEEDRSFLEARGISYYEGDFLEEINRSAYHKVEGIHQFVENFTEECP